MCEQRVLCAGLSWCAIGNDGDSMCVCKGGGGCLLSVATSNTLRFDYSKMGQPWGGSFAGCHAKSNRFPSNSIASSNSKKMTLIYKRFKQISAQCLAASVN